MRQTMADALASYRATPPVDASQYPPRALIGPNDAPVRIIEFFDILCGHCKAFSEALHEIEQGSAPGSFSIDLRVFPLDGSCNPDISSEMVDKTGARCAAAKALICLEPTGNMRKAQEAMFREQNALNRDRVIELAAQAGMPKQQLLACMEAKETTQKLHRDIAFAKQYDIHGTPLVIINGRKAMSMPPFVYAMILAGGDPGANGWSVLPPGQVEAPHNH
jgi:protein-disulfide isomerase